MSEHIHCDNPECNATCTPSLNYRLPWGWHTLDTTRHFCTTACLAAYLIDQDERHAEAEAIHRYDE